MAVAGYELDIDGSVLDVGDVLTHDVSGLGANTTHQFRVRSYDAAGNRGEWCNFVAETTDP